MTTIEIYYSASENSYAVYEKDTYGKLLEEDAVLIKELSGKDWDDCMTKYHEYMGWEPYKPF